MCKTANKVFVSTQHNSNTVEDIATLFQNYITQRPLGTLPYLWTQIVETPVDYGSEEELTSRQNSGFGGRSSGSEIFTVRKRQPED